MVTLTACNSPSLVPAKAFTHALAVDGAQRWVFVSGQVAIDATGKVLAPGDLFAQLELTLKNLGHALHAAGADFQHLVKVTIFVVDLDPADLAQIREVRSRYLPQDPPIAITLVGVARLAFPGLRIEIEGTAAL
jgi:enamine deaminase RidA (YjgF/YER057c/UK114 family)